MLDFTEYKAQQHALQLLKRPQFGKTCSLLLQDYLVFIKFDTNYNNITRVQLLKALYKVTNSIFAEACHLDEVAY